MSGLLVGLAIGTALGVVLTAAFFWLFQSAMTPDPEPPTDDERRAAKGDLAAAQSMADRAETARRIAERARSAAERELASYALRVQRAVQGAALFQPLGPAARRRRDDIGDSRIPIIAFSNLKGGVGKTTLAANLGAYLGDGRDQFGSERDPIARMAIDGPKAPVLFVDLDFQGSLSATLLAQIGAANLNRVARLFEAGVTAEEALAEAGRLDDAAAPLAPGSAFFDCGFEAARFEDRLFFDWAVRDQSEDDPRLSLFAFLRSAAVQERFGAVILDLPPRNTMFAVNALMAATDLVIPTRADPLSSAAVGVLVQQLETLRPVLWPDLRIAGVIGSMTQFRVPKPVEEAALDAAAGDVNVIWGARQPAIEVLATIPSRTAITQSAGRTFAYFNDEDGERGATPHDVFLDIGRLIRMALSPRPKVGLSGAGAPIVARPAE